MTALDRRAGMEDDVPAAGKRADDGWLGSPLLLGWESVYINRVS